MQYSDYKCFRFGFDSTDQLIFSVPALIEMISVAMSLEPGNVIITGTPGGVGAARKPPCSRAMSLKSRSRGWVS
jgi:2-keto-4-pentenoate hydratase/2-oxohepta-3-ene-1,7-dioic acid hydratase in catechol pathway